MNVMKVTITVPVLPGKIDPDGHLNDRTFEAVADVLDDAQRLIARTVAEDSNASDWTLEFVPASEAITRPIVGSGASGAL
jgi:hypothetical protein